MEMECSGENGRKVEQEKIENARAKMEQSTERRQRPQL